MALYVDLWSVFVPDHTQVYFLKAIGEDRRFMEMIDSYDNDRHLVHATIKFEFLLIKKCVL